MRRAAIVLASLACTLPAFGQISAADLLSRLSKGRTSMSYTYSVEGDIPVKGSGTLTVQGLCFRAEGNGAAIISDGSTRWSIDNEAKEVYIEAADGTIFLEQYLRGVKDIKEKNGSYSFSFTDAESGATAKVTLSGISSTPASDNLGIFKPDLSSMGKDWVTTDLR